MRIGIEIERYDVRRGGAEVYADRLARRLLADGHEVHVFASEAHEPPAGVRLHSVRPFHYDSSRAAVRAADLDVVVGTGKSGGMNVFQPHSGTIPGNLARSEAMIRPAALRTVHRALRRINPRHRRILSIERRQYAQSDPAPIFLAVSNMVARQMGRDYGVAPDRIRVVHNGVDVERFSPAKTAPLRAGARRDLGVDAPSTVFLLVAHNFALKGVRELIEAAGRVGRRRRDFWVLIAGKGRPGAYQRLAAARGCADRVRFLGPRPDVRALYAAADVYFHPTWYDACSLTVLEAVGCGLPVVTTRWNGASELLTDGVDALLLDSPEDVPAMAETIEKLFDPRLRARLAAAARSRALEITEDQHYRRVLAVFEEAAWLCPCPRRAA